MLIMEFSHPTSPAFKNIYDAFSHNLIPKMGEIVANDRKSYEYLVESIRKFDDQETLKGRMESEGFVMCKYTEFTGGIVAVHEGWKL